MRTRGWFLAAALMSLAAAPGLTGQETRDTLVAAGAHYAAGGLHRFLFGGDYRDLWALPVRVPILDLATYGGGLTPTTAGGRFQTKSLRFHGADGREYGFRSVDKDPAVLPPELQGTFIEDLVQDQTSSGLPFGPAVTAPLMAAAGILHTEPELVLLPDDPALGQFRERFAATLGFLEARAIVHPGAPPFAGADEIISGGALIDRRLASAADRIDVRAFLSCRLFDLLIGDWDRHRDQWRWARFGAESVTHWVPIPEDRDLAFVRYDGLMLTIARNVAPFLTNFGHRYPNIAGATWNGRDLDRLLLAELARPVWDSVAAALQARLTDSVIAAAVAALPVEARARRGAWLADRLRARRDALGAAAEAFYRLLAREPEVYGTAAADTVMIERRPSGAVAVRVRGPLGPVWEREFDPGETREIRIYLGAGPDRVTVRGSGPDRITLRVVGSGDDVVADSVGGIRFYAAPGDALEGPGRVHVDRRPWTPPPHVPSQPPRDWGSRYQVLAVLGYAPDVGAWLGAGWRRIGYGFRGVPNRSDISVRTGFATAAATGRLDVEGVWRRPNSRVRFETAALASGIEVIRFHGVGNETTAPQGDAYYRVKQATLALSSSLVLPLGRAEVSFGPIMRWADTDSTPGRLIALAPPYGTGKFGQGGARGELRLDSRDVAARPSRGLWLRLGGAVYPAVWDVESLFGEVHGETATYVTARAVPLAPTLALRVGGKRVWGAYPFHEAAFIGTASTVRLGRQHRYGGDAAAWGNAELRLRLGHAMLLLPTDFGVFGLADVGRVWLRGETSDRWHGAMGGGVWLSPLSPATTFSVAVARSAERVGVYVRAGFAY